MFTNKSDVPTPPVPGSDAFSGGSGVAISDRRVDIGDVAGLVCIACIWLIDQDVNYETFKVKVKDVVLGVIIIMICDSNSSYLLEE